jgi:hypothetical protein
MSKLSFMVDGTLDEWTDFETFEEVGDKDSFLKISIDQDQIWLSKREVETLCNWMNYVLRPT